MQIQPYLFLEGRCEEAIEFYKNAIGAKVLMLMHYKDSPVPHQPGMVKPGMESKVMHCTLQVGDSTIMVSDGENSGKTNFAGFSLSINAHDDAHAAKLFDDLSDGGQVHMPLTKTFFSSSFGMLADRFGLGWMVIVPQS